MRVAMLCLLLSVAPAFAQDAAPPSFAAPATPEVAPPAFDWLAGDWRRDDPDSGQWTIEHWEPMRGGTMLGVGQSGDGAQAGSFEFMRITVSGGDAVFYGAPGGAAPVPFRMTEFRPESTRDGWMVRFENPDHDFPRRVQYRRVGDVLIARVSGADPENDAITWRYRRIAP